MKINQHETDLQILPETTEELQRVLDLAKDISYVEPVRAVSDVQGQDWYGKIFIELPFSVNLINKFRELMPLNQRYEKDKVYKLYQRLSDPISKKIVKRHIAFAKFDGENFNAFGVTSHWMYYDKFVLSENLIKIRSIIIEEINEKWEHLQPL